MKEKISITVLWILNPSRFAADHVVYTSNLCNYGTNLFLFSLGKHLCHEWNGFDCILIICDRNRWMNFLHELDNFECARLFIGVFISDTSTTYVKSTQQQWRLTQNVKLICQSEFVYIWCQHDRTTSERSCFMTIGRNTVRQASMNREKTFFEWPCPRITGKNLLVGKTLSWKDDIRDENSSGCWECQQLPTSISTSKWPEWTTKSHNYRAYTFISTMYQQHWPFSIVSIEKIAVSSPSIVRSSVNTNPEITATVSVSARSQPDFSKNFPLFLFSSNLRKLY